MLALHDNSDRITQISEGSCKKSVELPCFLEIDMMHMIYTDRSLGENFVKCFMRYYAMLPSYVLQNFIVQLEAEKHAQAELLKAIAGD
jgi:hypothetical protein